MAEGENRYMRVLQYLWDNPGWHSPTAIAKTLWPGTGKHSAYTSPICQTLVRQGQVERNERGHYRVKE